MTDKQRMLAKALHTTTAVKNIAAYLKHSGLMVNRGPAWRAQHALQILGYSKAECERNPELLAACVKAVI